jgi:hypothetical protein
MNDRPNLSNDLSDHLAYLWQNGGGQLAYPHFIVSDPWDVSRAYVADYLDKVVVLAKELGPTHPAVSEVIDMARHVQAWLWKNPVDQDPQPLRAAAVAEWNGPLEERRQRAWAAVGPYIDIRPPATD